MLKIHKEGYGIIRNLALVLIVLAGAGWFFLPRGWAFWLSLLFLLLLLFVIRFFRVPFRPVSGGNEEGIVYSPADGTVVAIETTDETEYLGERRIQVSVFMSIWNIHINWFPVGGTVEYFRYHPGKFLVAWHPKSSEENERTTTVVRMKNGTRVLFRQIAGMVARRIVSYAREGDWYRQNAECGFIKFGSRVDVFLPVDAEICVKLEDKVIGTQTVLARLKSEKPAEP